MGKKIDRWLLLIILVVAAVAVFLWKAPIEWPWETGQEDLSGYIDRTEEETSAQEVEAPETAEASSYVSPVDFEELQKVNKDIYAWLEIPGTNVSYPILQHPTEDEYYLRRNYKGEDDKEGCLFTECSYNDGNMGDRMTVIYGHNMKNGEMFGLLQELYSGEDALQQYGEAVIYLPDRELHYQIFAAVPYSNVHILYNYDFDNMRMAEIFYRDILNTRAIGACVDQEAYISADTDGIILSTCLSGNHEKRFLVAAQLIKEMN